MFNITRVCVIIPSILYYNYTVQNVPSRTSIYS